MTFEVYIVKNEGDTFKAFSDIYNARVCAFNLYLEKLKKDKSNSLEFVLEEWFGGYDIASLTVEELLESELGEFEIEIEKVEVE